MKTIDNKSVKFETLSSRGKAAIIRILRYHLVHGLVKRGDGYNISGSVRECGIRTQRELRELAQNYKLTGEYYTWDFVQAELQRIVK